MTQPYPQPGENPQWGPGHAPATPGYGHPPAAPGYGYPAYPPPAGYGFPQQAPAPGGAPLLSLGDITVVGDQIITPAGTLPLRGAVWNATDFSHTEEKIPPHAIVLAILFFVFCLLGLFFLLMKEKKTTGYIQVSVTSAGRHHSTMIPAHRQDAFPAVMAQVAYARSLSGM
ncbi:hypothetical protein ACGFZR_17170 [Streptomyces sp. NPDC048241]|uniref:hypothetical protein n=1 Tax=Streptomyces sp. NPDC048241 TaxID=3365521 RepID=UPI00371CC917